jgi:hypothetical protein
LCQEPFIAINYYGEVTLSIERFTGAISGGCSMSQGEMSLLDFEKQYFSVMLSVIFPPRNFFCPLDCLINFIEKNI